MGKCHARISLTWPCTLSDTWAFCPADTSTRVPSPHPSPGATSTIRLRIGEWRRCRAWVARRSLTPSSWPIQRPRSRFDACFPGRLSEHVGVGSGPKVHSPALEKVPTGVRSRCGKRKMVRSQSASTVRRLAAPSEGTAGTRALPERCGMTAPHARPTGRDGGESGRPGNALRIWAPGAW